MDTLLSMLKHSSCCFVREEKRSASDAVINAVVVHREGLRLISNISMSSSVNRKLNTSGFRVLMLFAFTYTNQWGLCFFILSLSHSLSVNSTGCSFSVKAPLGY